MTEKINNYLTCPRTCLDDTLTTFKGLLRVASIHVFLHSVKNLLNIYPDIAGSYVIRLTSLNIFGYFTVNLFIITSEDLGNIRILCFNVKTWFTHRIIQKLLSHGHPVFLGAVTSLITDGNVTASRKRSATHHDHKIWHRLKPCCLISTKPYI